MKIIPAYLAACGALHAQAAITALDTAGDVGYTPSIAVGSDGLPIIAYYDYTNRGLKIVKCGNASCSAGNAVTVVDTARLEYDYSSLAIGADGLPVISYRRILRQTVM